MGKWTKGPWVIDQEDDDTLEITTEARMDNCMSAICAVEVGYVGKHETEQRANADLIAEAGTVAHETGLTPRQLAEQRVGLLAALKWYKDQMCEGFCTDLREDWTYHKSMDDLCAGCKARAAIANAERKP